MRKPLFAAIAVATLSAGAAFGLTAANAGDSQLHAYNLIHPAYSFEVEDTTKLMGYSENVFIGRVEKKARTLVDEVSTVWTVQVLESLKGDATGEVEIRQTGFVDDKNRIYETEDQPMLRRGREYLLAVNPAPGGGYVVVVKASDHQTTRCQINCWRPSPTLRWRG